MPETEGAAEFALALRELKDRSGLSYGALAKRLHMSTSTLHRYCNGDAVPTEFAPVERLARVCRATPDEMVRVHRLWILADATRGRRAGSGAGAGPGSGGAGPVRVPEEAAPGVREPGRASEEFASARASEESAPGLASEESAPSTAPTAPPAAPAAPAAPDGSGRARSSPAVSDPAPLVSSVADVPGRTPTRRRNTLLAAAAVLAVAASTVLVTQFTGGGPGHDDAPGGRPVSARTPAGPTAGADGGGPVTSPPATVTPPPPPAPASTGPGGGLGRKGSVGGDKEKREGQGSSGAGVPFSATVRPFVYESPCSQFFLVDSPPEQVSPPPSEQDAPGWAASFKAVSADEQLVALTLQGRTKETVVLEALHVRVVRSGAPLPWNRYAAGVGCGGNVDTKSFAVDLDAGRPVTVPHAGQRDFPYKISETDPEVFYVKAKARTHDVSWYLELEWSSGDRHGVQRIDSHGKPFRTSGSAGRPEYVHPLGSSAWEKPLDEGGGPQEG
ncbi:helix-turn-helix transcriptional regulator [Streptomyces cremeus]|uniref:Helix-turn-helix domain-containing protein n=1 Tax=Streptomyces cremeus TaxID=66881 RepID=A0ABV5PHZ8_STRCM